MMTKYTEGMALILEGATEKVFYKSLLEYVQSSDCNIKMQRKMEDDSGDILYEWEKGGRKVAVKIYVVGTITQLVHSGKWFASRCARKYNIPWTVFLCYDTDSSSEDISKFYEGAFSGLWICLSRRGAIRKFNTGIRYGKNHPKLSDKFMQISGIFKKIGLLTGQKIKGCS